MKIRYFLSLIVGLSCSPCLVAQQVTSDSVTSETKLGEVEIVAYKRINKGDIHKQVFELSQQGVPPNFSVDRALRFVPNLTQHHDGYSILGSNKSAKVLIDGVVASPEELQALSARDVWRVELLRGGVDGDRINIRRFRRLSHQFKGRVGAGIRLPERYSVNASLIWQSPTANLSLTPGGVWSRQEIESRMERRTATQDNVWQYQSEAKIRQENAALRFNYYPNKHWDNTLLAVYSGINTRGESFSKLNAQSSEKLSDQSGTQVLGGHLASKYSWAKSFLRLRGQIFSETEHQELGMHSALHQAKNRYHSLGGDLTYQSILSGKLGKHTLSYNYAFMRRETHSVYNTMKQKSLIHSLQVGDEVEWGEGWGGDLRLLLQSDAQYYQGIRQQRWYLLPSASIYYSGGRDAVELSYEQSIYRPTGQLLDPERYYRSDTEYTEGNPNLSNEQMHSLVLRYQRQIKRTYLSMALSYEQTRDVLGRIHSALDPNLQVWDNIGKSQELAVSLGVNSFFLQRKLSLNLSTKLGYVDNRLSSLLQSRAVTLGGAGVVYRANLNLSYRTSKEWSYTVYAQWSGRKLGFSSRQDYAPYVYFELDKDVIADVLSFSLSVLNPWGVVRNRTDYLFRDIAQSSWGRNNASSGISLGLRYSFGKRFRTHQGNEMLEQYDRKRP